MTPHPDELLSDDLWLRRVAFALTRDAHLAEDLAQDAWVAGLEGRGRGRAWMGGLLRYRSWAERRRVAGERSKIERAARERPEVGPGADEAAEVAEMRGLVAEELLALDEPLREAVHLRFVGGRSIAEIARRTSVSTSTASDRVRRGVEELRRRMDGRFGGERAAWAAPLAGLAAPELGASALAAASPAGSSLLPSLFAAGGAAVLLAGGAWLGMDRTPSDSGSEARLAGVTELEEAVVTGVQPAGDGRVEAIGQASPSAPGRRGFPAPPAASRVPIGSSAKGDDGGPSPAAAPVRVAPGESLPDPLPEGSIEVIVREPVLFGAAGQPLDPDHLHLVPRSAPARALGPIGSEGARAAFGPLPADEYRLEIDDPRFDSFVREGIRAGTRVGVELVGSASLELDLRTRDGRRVSALDAQLTYQRIASSVSTFRAPVAGDVVDDLLPWSYELVVRTNEGVAHAMIEPALEPREQRRVELIVEASSALTGALVRPDGEPAEGVRVQLVRLRDGAQHRPGTEILELGQFSSHPPARRAVAEETSGADGRFAFVVERPGRYVVHAGNRFQPWAETSLIDVGAGETIEAGPLTVRRGGTLRGAVRYGGGQDLGGRLLLWWGADASSPVGPGAGPAVLDANGRFELRGVAPGRGAFWLYPAGDPKRLMGYSTQPPAGGIHVGSARAEEGRAVEVDLELGLDR